MQKVGVFLHFFEDWPKWHNKVAPADARFACDGRV